MRLANLEEFCAGSSFICVLWKCVEPGIHTMLLIT
jgi:hypothetical protein